MHGSSGCLGSYTKSKFVNSADQPPEEPGVENHKSKIPSIVEDIWTTSTCDMDNSAVQSQGSISSFGANNQTVDTHGGAGSTNGPPEFVNHGLLLWNQTRQQWVANKKSENRSQQAREPKLNWNASYESLLGSNKPFPRPIPLPEMVDFLVDVWEQEGMYD